MDAKREFEGKDLEEALQAASTSLGIAEPELDYEIVEQGRRGLFGLGARSVRIRVMPPVEPLAPHAQQRPERTERKERERPERQERSDRPASGGELMLSLKSLPIARDWTPDRSREWWDRHAPSARAQLHAVAIGS